MADEYTLYNGVRVPAIGYGTYLTDKAITEDCVLRALETGYRHIDTAAFYGNERETGNAVRRSGLRREEVFVTSKLWATDRGYKKALTAFDRTVSELGLGAPDLYLIHWPESPSRTPDWEKINLETWQALTELYEAGKVRAIGVSNFLPHHLDALIKTKVPPMTNQIEFNPGVKQPETTAYCKEHGLLVEAWSPLGSGKLLQEPKLHAIAEKYGKSPAQLCLRWILQKGILPLPKSVTKERILQNTQLFDFCISSEDVQIMDSLSCVGRTGSDPDNAKF